MKLWRCSASIFELIKLIPLIPGYLISSKTSKAGLADILLYSATHGWSKQAMVLDFDFEVTVYNYLVLKIMETVKTI